MNGQRLLRILFWSILAAAFIGPGTVTTAASAGAQFGTTLAWALVFSALATLVLQEFAARLTINTGNDLGRTLALQFPVWVRWLAAAAVAVGCAAYEAGNLLGGIAGVELLREGTRLAGTLAATAIAALLLWFARTELVARILGLVVAVMGICFGIAAAGADIAWAALLRDCVVPRLPDGSTTLAMALIGTTVVPYNLFLGSALAQGQDIHAMRWGLCVAVPLGGIISLMVLVVGTALHGTMEFARLAAELRLRLGDAGPWVLGLGLFAAGFSSALTAPLATALALRGIFGDAEAPAWHDDGRWSRLIKLTVLGIGAGVALSGVRPVPAIVAAQLLNGLLLPIAAAVLWWAMRRANQAWLNALGLLVVAIAAGLGLRGILRVLGQFVGG